VLEQNYEYVLVPPTSCSRIHRKQIGVLQRTVALSGSLQSFDANQLVIRQEGRNGDGDGAARGNVKDIQFRRVAEGFDPKPTLVWKLATRRWASRLIEVALNQNGHPASTAADYKTLLECQRLPSSISVAGSDQLISRRGRTRTRKLKLILAGDVRRVEQTRGGMKYRACQRPGECSGAGFRGEGVF